MTSKRNKKILTVLMQWDYGDKSRGPSNDRVWFSDNFALLAPGTEPFWYDAWLNDLPGLRKALIEKAESFNPDLIFFLPYTGQFDAKTLDLLKAKWPTCAWFGDDTWRFESYSSKLAPHFTHVCTTDPFSVEKYRKLGIEPIVTQWAAQPFPGLNGPLAAGETYSYEISFVGARNEVRAWFIDRLAKAGIKVECFGAGWPSGRVSLEQMGAIFRASKINLNLSNSVSRDIRFVLGGPRNFLRYLISPKTAEQIKGRNFEIPLAGGFQLSNYVPDLERYLEIGGEVSMFTTPEDCARQINYYLANEPERAKIMLAGHERAKKEHTYLRRLEEILEKIWG